MIIWLQKIIQSSPVKTLSDLTYVLLVVFGLIAIFFLRSPRMNARLESPAPRRSGHSNVFINAAVKFKLLPDGRTGQRMNFFLLIYAGFVAANFCEKLSDIPRYDALVVQRRVALQLSGMWQLHLLGIVTIAAALLLLLPLFLVRKNREFYFDVLVLFLALAVAFVKLFMCFPSGCCFGIPSTWGIYSHIIETTVLPVQLFEAIGGFIAFIFCTLYMLYAKSYRPGRGCAVSLLCYAVPRFYWDFLCYHGEAYRLTDNYSLFGLKMTQTFGLAASVLAIAWLIWLLPLEKKLMDRFWLFVDQRRAERQRA